MKARSPLHSPGLLIPGALFYLGWIVAVLCAL
jgi:hypothetical protein